MISRRAEELGRHDPFLVKAHFACAAEPFDPAANPNGYVNFGTAENRILFDLVGPLLRESQEIAEADTHYNELHGAAFFRRAIVEFLGRRASRPLSPDNIAIASGATGILEILAFVLCDSGDAILIPSPYYSGFDHDLALRSEARLYHIPLRGPDFELTMPTIERAYAEAVSGGLRVRAILVNSPQNPLGQVYSEALIRDATAFAREKHLHVILDEIYAESVMPGVSHFSGLRLESDLIHVVYGFAKDFGLSGYKVGILHSEDSEVVKAVQDSAYFYSVSMQTQRALANLLSRPQIDGFLKGMRERLVKVYELTREDLASNAIDALPVEGGIVLWLDLRRYLPSASFEGERALFDAVLEECRVNISPGQAFHCPEPGWFRLCFTVPEPERAEGLRRLTAYLRPRQPVTGS
jgi:aspartate/methionine/tyrosine aminotransferase